MLENLSPARVFRFFEELSAIPRGSGNTDAVSDYCVRFAKKRSLDCVKDQLNNVIIRKPASKGYEGHGGVILQGHLDMVCEKTADSGHDFTRDGLKLRVDGDLLSAEGTTLGADDGIGVAMEMAILMSDDIEHGPIECVFTRDEETGLTGAEGMKSDFMTGDFLINLDSEDEGQMFVSCAGGARTAATFDCPTEKLPAGYFCFTVGVKGLTGGHSGDDIKKKRANANKLLVRFLVEELGRTDLRLLDIQSGGLHNAIPREGHALCAVPMDYKEQVRADLNVFAAAVEEEFSVTEKTMEFVLESAADAPQVAMQREAARRMLLSLHAVHNGVFAMSQDIDWLVETSSNLASIHKEGDKVVVTTSQRSSVASARENVSSVVRAAFELGGATVVTNEGYPGWKLNPESVIVKIARESYVRLFGKEPEVLAIHAGLECGLFSEKYPHLDMVSFGPTLRGVHSPDERLLLPTVKMVWDHLLDMLKHIPEA